MIENEQAAGFNRGERKLSKEIELKNILEIKLFPSGLECLIQSMTKEPRQYGKLILVLVGLVRGRGCAM